jgi:hypothetical protein
MFVTHFTFFFAQNFDSADVELCNSATKIWQTISSITALLPILEIIADKRNNKLFTNLNRF